MRPSFQKAWSEYPADPKSPYGDGVEHHPCRKPDGTIPPGYENQCAMRVGLALHHAGMDFSKYRGNKCSFKGHGGHIRGAQELANWLGGQLGGSIKYTEHVHGTKPNPGSKAFEELRGQTGIVFFRDFWGQNSTGDHIDLWDGSKGKTVPPGDSYFTRSKEVWFWRLS